MTAQKHQYQLFDGDLKLAKLSKDIAYSLAHNKNINRLMQAQYRCREIRNGITSLTGRMIRIV